MMGANKESRERLVVTMACLVVAPPTSISSHPPSFTQRGLNLARSRGASLCLVADQLRSAWLVRPMRCISARRTAQGQ